jgi:PKD repeat protein
MNRFIHFISIFAIIQVSCNRKPDASFKLSNNAPEAGEEITFINTSENGTAFNWNFGDGEISLQQQPKHTYSVSGTYEVTLKVYGKKQKRVDSISYSLFVDKTMDQKISTLWNYDSTATYSYTDGVLTNYNSTHMAELYTIHTASFSQNGTYSTNLDGAIYNGSWNVLLNNYSILLDGEITYVEFLSGNLFSFFAVQDFVGSAEEQLTDTSFVYLSI